MIQYDPTAKAVVDALSNQRNRAFDALAEVDAMLFLERAETTKLRERVTELEKQIEETRPKEPAAALKAVEWNPGGF